MSSLVVMSKGTKFTQQSYKVSDSFPFEWIKKKWREAFHVTAMATSGTQWAVVMSRGAGFLDQVRWQAGRGSREGYFCFLAGSGPGGQAACEQVGAAGRVAGNNCFVLWNVGGAGWL
jgi:hypothetical protein